MNYENILLKKKILKSFFKFLLIMGITLSISIPLLILNIKFLYFIYYLIILFFIVYSIALIIALYLRYKMGEKI